MSTLLKTIRIAGFRGMENIEVMLEQTTVITGLNNTGKTSLLKAIQIALGNWQFISTDDFFVHGNNKCEQITIDLLILPADDNANIVNDFTEDWEELLTTDRIRTDGIKSFVPLRTIITFNPLNSNHQMQQFILPTWSEFDEHSVYWYQQANGNKTSFHFDELPFFYMDAQRDILEDIKQKKSYLGKMLANLKYSQKDTKEIEAQIKQLNERAVNSSAALDKIRDTLKDLSSAIGNHNNSIEITPFTKKLRDLNKGLSIYYNDNQDSFSMQRHGMGTRSWSSLLTLKSFINHMAEEFKNNNKAFFPLLAVEEPEAHLHPNAQKNCMNKLIILLGKKLSPLILLMSLQLPSLNNFAIFIKMNMEFAAAIMPIA